MESNISTPFRSSFRYGSSCYRKNPLHLQEFYHPPPHTTSESTGTNVNQSIDGRAPNESDRPKWAKSAVRYRDSGSSNEDDANDQAGTKRGDPALGDWGLPSQSHGFNSKSKKPRRGADSDDEFVPEEDDDNDDDEDHDENDGEDDEEEGDESDDKNEGQDEAPKSTKANSVDRSKAGASKQSRSHQEPRQPRHAQQPSLHPAARSLPPCRYGIRCYRKNPAHFRQFSHPWDPPTTTGRIDRVDSPTSNNGVTTSSNINDSADSRSGSSTGSITGTESSCSTGKSTSSNPGNGTSFNSGGEVCIDIGSHSLPVDDKWSALPELPDIFQGFECYVHGLSPPPNKRYFSPMLPFLRHLKNLSCSLSSLLMNRQVPPSFHTTPAAQTRSSNSLLFTIAHLRVFFCISRYSQ